MTGLLSELMNDGTIRGVATEPFAVLVFGILLLVLTAGLRMIVGSEKNSPEFAVETLIEPRK